ncbi:MAG: hypothetical protein U0236_02980 [Nitrospira sp.]
MACGRCGGLMVVESVYVEGAVLPGEPQAARCLNCGNIEDDVICLNRLEPNLSSGTAYHYVGVQIEPRQIRPGQPKDCGKQL